MPTCEDTSTYYTIGQGKTLKFILRMSVLLGLAMATLNNPSYLISCVVFNDNSLPTPVAKCFNSYSKHGINFRITISGRFVSPSVSK